MTDEPPQRVGLGDFHDIPSEYGPWPFMEEAGTENGAAGDTGLVRSEEFSLEVRTAPEFMAIPEPDESELLLGPYIQRGARTIIVGDTGHGKTTIALHMIAAVLKGEEWVERQGQGCGPALVVDLEQGVRSIKRGLREAALTEREDLLYAAIPDGLALDANAAHLAALAAVIEQYHPIMLLLDPFYKAHRAEDPNQERPIVDLMRVLDGLRKTYGFALILPAHPRKPIVSAEGVRKLTVHDVAGSGATTRGAEIVLGIERLGHGYARLRYLKDRDGDLPIGEAIGLTFSKEEGFRRDPKDQGAETIEDLILAEPRDWMTADEWRKELKTQKNRTLEVLRRLVESGQVASMTGPAGRGKTARCFGTSEAAFREASQQPALEAEDDDGIPF